MPEAADRLGGALLVVLLGFVTGGMAAPVFVGWVLRRHGQPEAQGRRARVYLWAATGLVVGMAAWLLIWPWF